MIFFVVVGVLSVLVTGGTIALTALFVPAKYIGLTFINIVGLLLYNLVFDLCAFSTGYLYGVLIGKPVVLLVATIGTPIVAQSLSGTYSDAIDSVDVGTLVYPVSAFWLYLGVASLATVVLAAVSWIIERKKSAEYDGNAITFPVLGWPIVILLTIVLPLTNVIPTNEYSQTGYSVLNILLIAAVFVIGVIWQESSKITNFWRKRVAPRWRAKRVR